MCNHKAVGPLLAGWRDLPVVAKHPLFAACTALERDGMGTACGCGTSHAAMAEYDNIVIGQSAAVPSNGG